MERKFDYKIVKAKNQPAKEKLLFIHGYAVDISYWTFIEDKFPNYDLYFINLPGHGNLKVSNDINEMKEKLRLDYMAQYVIDFINDQKLNNFILIGHSMGGEIASLVENKCRDKIKKFILISPMNYASIYTGVRFVTKFFPKNMKQKMVLLSYLYKDIDSRKNDKEWMRMNEEQLQNQLQQWDQMKFLGKKEMANFKTLLKIHKAQKNIKMPFMLCLGKYDGCVKYKPTKRNFLKHHKDKMHLVTFEKSSHLCFEEETDKFVKEITNYIDGK